MLRGKNEELIVRDDEREAKCEYLEQVIRELEETVQGMREEKDQLQRQCDQQTLLFEKYSIERE